MTENNSLYVALIGDIHGSRTLDNRNEVQDEFKTLVTTLNDHVPTDAIASPFTVTTGDEFQVLLHTANDAVDAAITASDRFHPARLRFGIGRGTLDTDRNPDQAIGMDGPCFHRARQAIEAADHDDAWIRVNGWSTLLDDHVNAMFDLVHCIRQDWTDRQAEYARTLKAEGTQQRVADIHDVAKSTVSESLTAGHVRKVHTAEHRLAQLLEATLTEAALP